MVDIFAAVDVVENSFRIAQKGSEILDLSGVYSDVVTVALKTIQYYGNTVLCFLAARDLPISHTRTIAQFVQEGTSVVLMGRLFCDMVNSLRDMLVWADRMGLCDLAYLSSATASFSAYGQPVVSVFQILLAKPVQDVCSVVSVALDIVHQGQEIFRNGMQRKYVISITKDVLKMAIKTMSFMPQIYAWKVAMNSCSIINSAASIYLTFQD